jgi:hypothetical protein
VEDGAAVVEVRAVVTRANRRLRRAIAQRSILRTGRKPICSARMSGG